MLRPLAPLRTPLPLLGVLAPTPDPQIADPGPLLVNNVCTYGSIFAKPCLNHRAQSVLHVAASVPMAPFPAESSARHRVQPRSAPRPSRSRGAGRVYTVPLLQRPRGCHLLPSPPVLLGEALQGERDEITISLNYPVAPGSAPSLGKPGSWYSRGSSSGAAVLEKPVFDQTEKSTSTPAQLLSIAQQTIN